MRLPDDTPIPHLKGATVKLQKALYGLKQAGFEWYNHLKSKLKTLNWNSDDLFPCKFQRNIGDETYFLLVYVDDIIITGPKNEFIKQFKSEIQSHFDIEDLGEVNFLLGMRIVRDAENGPFHLDQEAMISRLLEHYQITGKSRIPCNNDIRRLKFDPENGTLADTRTYQSKIGSLLYISRYTRPDISYATAFLARFSHAPEVTHMDALNRLLKYLNQTKTTKFTLDPNQTDKIWKLEVFADADYADHSDSTESTSGQAIFLSGALVSWGSTRQNSTSLSTTESEYVAISNAARKAQMIANFIESIPNEKYSVKLLCDNQSTIKSIERMAIPPKLKHINVKIHHVRDLLKTNAYIIEYVPTTKNTADIFTKGLPRQTFEIHSKSLGLELNNR